MGYVILTLILSAGAGVLAWMLTNPEREPYTPPKGVWIGNVWHDV